MPPLPPCETTGLINLCAPAHIFNWPSWFYLQLPNAIWIGLVLLLFVVFLFLPFPANEIDTTGYETGEGG